MHGDIIAAIAPHTTPRARKDLLRSLERLMESLRPPKPRRQPHKLIRHDPAAAAEWFAQRGARVERSDSATPSEEQPLEPSTA